MPDITFYELSDNHWNGLVNVWWVSILVGCLDEQVIGQSIISKAQEAVALTSLHRLTITVFTHHYPCFVYVLRRADIMKIDVSYPLIRVFVEEADIALLP